MNSNTNNLVFKLGRRLHVRICSVCRPGPGTLHFCPGPFPEQKALKTDLFRNAKWIMYKYPIMYATQIRKVVRTWAGKRTKSGPPAGIRTCNRRQTPLPKQGKCTHHERASRCVHFPRGRLMSLAPSDQSHATAAHREVLLHLSKVACVDKDSELVVKKYAKQASVWHQSIETTINEVLPGRSCVRIQTVLNCISQCADNDTPPPPFVIYFQHQFMHDWASKVVDRLVSRGGRRWSIPECAQLASNLKNMTSKGLCHRKHVNLSLIHI